MSEAERMLSNFVCSGGNDVRRAWDEVMVERDRLRDYYRNEAAELVAVRAERDRLRHRTWEAEAVVDRLRAVAASAFKILSIIDSAPTVTFDGVTHHEAVELLREKLAALEVSREDA